MAPISLSRGETQEIARAPQTRRRSPTEKAAAEPSRGRVRQIDVLKGLAIIGVIARPASPPRFLQRSSEILSAGQAVPVFFVIVGLNTAPLESSTAAQLYGDLYGRPTSSSRSQRLVVFILSVSPMAPGRHTTRRRGPRRTARSRQRPTMLECSRLTSA